MRRAFGRAGYRDLDGTAAIGLEGASKQDAGDVWRRGHKRAYPDGRLVGAADEVAVYPPRGIPGDQSPTGMQVEGGPDQGGTIPAEGPAIRTVEFGQVAEQERRHAQPTRPRGPLVERATTPQPGSQNPPSRRYTLRRETDSKPKDS